MKPCRLLQSSFFFRPSKRHHASKNKKTSSRGIEGEKRNPFRCKTITPLCFSLPSEFPRTRWRARNGSLLPMLLLLLSIHSFMWTSEALAANPPPPSKSSSITPSGSGSRSHTLGSSQKIGSSKRAAYGSADIAAAAGSGSPAEQWVPEMGDSRPEGRLAAAGASEDEAAAATPASAREKRKKEDEENREKETVPGIRASEKDACPAIFSLHDLFAGAAAVSSAPPSRCTRRGVRTPQGPSVWDCDAAGEAASAGNPRTAENHIVAPASSSPLHHSSSSLSTPEATTAPSSSSEERLRASATNAAAAASFSSFIPPAHAAAGAAAEISAAVAAAGSNAGAAAAGSNAGAAAAGSNAGAAAAADVVGEAGGEAKKGGSSSRTRWSEDRRSCASAGGCFQSSHASPVSSFSAPQPSPASPAVSSSSSSPFLVSSSFPLSFMPELLSTSSPCPSCSSSSFSFPPFPPLSSPASLFLVYSNCASAAAAAKCCLLSLLPSVREAPLLLEKRVHLAAPQQRTRQPRLQQQQQPLDQALPRQQRQQSCGAGPQQQLKFEEQPRQGSEQQQHQRSDGQQVEQQQQEEEEEGHSPTERHVDFVELVPLSLRLRLLSSSSSSGEAAAAAALLITCTRDGLLAVHAAAAAGGRQQQQQTQLTAAVAAHAAPVVGLAVLDRSDTTGETTIATVDASGELRLHLLRLHASPAAAHEAAADNAGPHQIDDNGAAAAATASGEGGEGEEKTAASADVMEARQSRLLLQGGLTASLELDFSVHHEALAAEGTLRVLTNFLGISYKGNKYLLATDSAGYVTVVSRSGALHGRVRVTAETGGVVHAVCRSGVIVLGSRRSFMQFHVSTMDVGRAVGVVDSPASIRSLALDPQRQTTLAVALQDGQLLLYNLKKATLLQKFVLSSLTLVPLRIYFFRDLLLGVAAAAPSPRRASACSSPPLFDCVGPQAQQGVVFTCALQTSAAAANRRDAPICHSFSLGSVAIKGAAALYQFTGGNFLAVAAAPPPTSSIGDAGDAEKPAGVRLFEVLSQQTHSNEEDPPWFNLRFPAILVAVIAVVVLQIFKSGKLFTPYHEDAAAASPFSPSTSFGIDTLRALSQGFRGFDTKNELRRKLQRADMLMRRTPRRGSALNSCGNRFDGQPLQQEQYGCGYSDEGDDCGVRTCLRSREVVKSRRRTSLSVASSSSSNSEHATSSAVVRPQHAENHFFPPQLIAAERNGCRRRALHRSHGCISQETAENCFSDDLLMS